MPPAAAAALLLPLLLLSPRPAAASAFSAGTLLVTQAGDGTAARNPATAMTMVPLSIKEFRVSRVAGGSLTGATTYNVVQLPSTAASVTAATGAFQLSVRKYTQAARRAAPPPFAREPHLTRQPSPPPRAPVATPSLTSFHRRSGRRLRLGRRGQAHRRRPHSFAGGAVRHHRRLRRGRRHHGLQREREGLGVAAPGVGAARRRRR